MPRSVLDRILESHNRERLVGIIGDTYLLLWDLYYQKYRGQSLYEDLIRVKIHVKGKSTGDYFSQGIAVDLNKACQLFESFDATNVTNFDMELDSVGVAELDERAAPKDQPRQNTNKTKYFANSIITSIPLAYQNFPIDGIRENEAEGIRDLFFDLRGSIGAIRGPRNRHQHGGLDPKSGELQAAAAAIRVCEIHQHLWGFLEKHSNGWRPVLNDENHYEFAWNSTRVDELKSHIWENLRHLDILKHEQAVQLRAPSVLDGDERIASNAAAQNVESSLIVEQLKNLQDSIDSLLDRPENDHSKTDGALLLISQKADNIDCKINDVLETINSAPLAKTENRSASTPQEQYSLTKDQSIQPISSRPVKEILMNLRNEIASQLRAEYQDFKPWHNILMRDLIDHVVSSSRASQLRSEEELKRSLYSTPQIRRITEMNENGKQMVDRQIEVYGQRILQVLCLPAPLISDDEEEIPF